MTNITPVQPVQTQPVAAKSLSPVNVVTGAKKGYNNVAEISKGVGSGVAKGAAVGTASFLAFWAVDVLKNMKNAEAPKSMFKDFVKPISKTLGNAVASVPRGIKALLTQPFSRTLKNVFVDAPVKVGKAFKNTKNISTPAKAVVAAISVATLGYSLVKSKLTANEKNAGVDHRWQVGHDKVNK